MDGIGAELRAAHPRALATLVRLIGGIDAAEDALQEAVARALTTWPERGVPDHPVGWLIRTARNAWIDEHRRQTLEARHRAEERPPAVGPLPPSARLRSPEEAFSEAALESHLRDDLLRLIFTCCHPELSPEEQIALTLRVVAGMTLDEIASAFLLAPRALEQRLTRAKRRIRERALPYSVPRSDQLAERLGAVLQVVYLIFNEGYKASAGKVLVRGELCATALRLARLLADLFRGESEVHGLLALMLLLDARRDARQDAAGELVTLDLQDRGRWNRQQIAEGLALVEKAARLGWPGRHTVHAAINAVHASAQRFEDTDWREIAELYRVLERLEPTPVVRLNRAVAVGRVEGPQAALGLLEEIAAHPEMQRYLPYHATRAALLAEAGKPAEARLAYRAALSLVRTDAERSHLQSRCAALG